MRKHGCNNSFVSGEDLALAAYGILLNSIIMYWALISPTKGLTFRKMDMPVGDMYSYRIGQTFTWLCFTSSSVDLSKANMFQGNCMLIFDNSQASKYAAKGIRKHSHFKSEEEYLYPSGVRFRIIGKNKTPLLTTFRILLEDSNVRYDSNYCILYYLFLAFQSLGLFSIPGLRILVFTVIMISFPYNVIRSHLQNCLIFKLVC